MNRIDQFQYDDWKGTDSVRIQRILVPVHFSVCPAEPLRYARTFAKESGALIHLLHVVQLNIAGEEYGVPRTGLIRQMGKAARDALHNLVQGLWDGEIPAIVMIREGRPHEVILQEARTTNANLIIMGTRGHSRFLSLLRRNTMARVMRQAPCPVLVLRVSKRHVPAGRASKIGAPFEAESGIRQTTMNA